MVNNKIKVNGKSLIFIIKKQGVYCCDCYLFAKSLSLWNAIVIFDFSFRSMASR